MALCDLRRLRHVEGVVGPAKAELDAICCNAAGLKISRKKFLNKLASTQPNSDSFMKITTG
jgi:hypothetical protein